MRFEAPVHFGLENPNPNPNPKPNPDPNRNPDPNPGQVDFGLEAAQVLAASCAMGER